MLSTMIMEKAPREFIVESNAITLSLPKEEKELFERLGFVYRDEIHVEIPSGWSLSYEKNRVLLVDEKGRNRGNVFIYHTNGIKKTMIELLKRYMPIFQFSEDDTCVSAYIKDNATGKSVYDFWTGSRNHYNVFELSAQMHEYLDQHYPLWEDYCAYWN